MIDTPAPDDVLVDERPRAVRLVVVPGLRRAHYLAEAGRVLVRSVSPWEDFPIWSAATTACGRAGPFEDAGRITTGGWAGFGLPRQLCGACSRSTASAWGGYEAGDDRAS